MKKLLLTLCMTLLCTIGVWAQSVDMTITTDPDNITVVVGGQEAILKVEYTGDKWAYSDASYSNSNNTVCTVEPQNTWATYPLKITGKKAGTSIITFTSNKTQGTGPATVTKTVSVTVLPAPLTLTATTPNPIMMGDGSKSVSCTVKESTTYSLSYQSLNTNVLTVDATGKITPVGAGKTIIRVTATPNDPTQYAVATKDIEVTVKINEFKLSVVNPTTTIDGTTGGNVSVTTTVTLNGTTTSSYNNLISYSLKGTYTGVTINSSTGSVTVASGTTAQAVTIEATLTPTDAAAYTSASATTGFIITDNTTVGVTITKTQAKDNNSINIITVNFPKSGLWTSSNQPVASGSISTLTNAGAKDTIKVTGFVSSSDIDGLSSVIGGTNTSKNPKILDMGESQLTEALSLNSNSHISNIKNLTLPKPAPFATKIPVLSGWVGQMDDNGSMEYLGITEGWTDIANNAFSDCYHLNNAYFPATLVTIGESAFEGCKNFETVDMKRCVLITEISKNAFRTSNTTSTTTVGLGSKVLNFPPNLVTLREGAFQCNKAPVLWMPKTIDRIEAYALADFNGNTLLTDIFFTGMTPPSYVHKDAFTKNAQTAGDGDANYNNLSTTGQADRDVYIRQRAGVFNGYCIVMHYPAGSNANMGYWDKENAYESRGRNMRPNVDKDGKASGKTEGAPNLYYYEPDGWLKYKAEKGTLPTYGCYAGYPDVTLGEKKVWPSESQIQGAYKMAQDGYLWNGDKMTAAQLNRQGLYQFVLASADTPSDEIKGYENNLWYTICLPYDMSVAQIKATFGNDTQVCRITKVTREPSGENMGIKLYFQRSVITPGGYGTSDIAKDTQYTSNDTGIKAYYPYMIKPSAETATSTRDQAGNLIRTFSDFQDSYKPGAIRRDIVTAIGQSDEHGPYTYAFVGTHEKTHLLQYSYYLGKNTSGKHQLFFRSATTASGLGLWNPFTALVRPTDAAAGLYDTNFFTKNGAAEKNVKMASLFGDDFDEDEATGIKDIQTNKNFNGKIYSISGQYAGTSIEDLPKGIYMVNGKKFIVK